MTKIETLERKLECLTRRVSALEKKVKGMDKDIPEIGFKQLSRLSNPEEEESYNEDNMPNEYGRRRR